jgi:hypothetical protein
VWQLRTAYDALKLEGTSTQNSVSRSGLTMSGLTRQQTSPGTIAHSPVFSASNPTVGLTLCSDRRSQYHGGRLVQLPKHGDRTSPPTLQVLPTYVVVKPLLSRFGRLEEVEGCASISPPCCNVMASTSLTVALVGIWSPDHFTGLNGAIGV